jgi:hypothetical protein
MPLHINHDTLITQQGLVTYSTFDHGSVANSRIDPIFGVGTNTVMLLCGILQYLVNHHTDAQMQRCYGWGFSCLNSHVPVFASIFTTSLCTGWSRPGREEAVRHPLVTKANLDQIPRFPGTVAPNVEKAILPSCRRGRDTTTIKPFRRSVYLGTIHGVIRPQHPSTLR